MSAEPIAYLDSSALVKLVVVEAESDVLAGYLKDYQTRVSCALARVEIVRAVRAHGDRAVRRARELLDRVALVRLDDVLLDAAAALEAMNLRSLDAIHLAAARALRADRVDVVTYDRRMAVAAQSLGLGVTAPSP